LLVKIGSILGQGAFAALIDMVGAVGVKESNATMCGGENVVDKSRLIFSPKVTDVRAPGDVRKF